MTSLMVMAAAKQKASPLPTITRTDGINVLTYSEALRTAIKIGRQGLGSIGDAVRLEQQVAAKAAAFVRDNTEPACYLYRHYDHAGDLLYVGISLSPLRRHERHVAGATWRYLIVQILIEPFTSREEALLAEACATRDEFPKFNTTHNRRRYPAFELRQNRRSNHADLSANPTAKRKGRRMAALSSCCFGDCRLCGGLDRRCRFAVQCLAQRPLDRPSPSRAARSNLSHRA